jgi:hypothetical protein
VVPAIVSESGQGIAGLEQRRECFMKRLRAAGMKEQGVRVLSEHLPNDEKVGCEHRQTVCEIVEDLERTAALFGISRSALKRRETHIICRKD